MNLLVTSVCNAAASFVDSNGRNKKLYDLTTSCVFAYVGDLSN